MQLSSLCGGLHLWNGAVFTACVTDPRLGIQASGPHVKLEEPS